MGTWGRGALEIHAVGTLQELSMGITGKSLLLPVDFSSLKSLLLIDII